MIYSQSLLARRGPLSSIWVAAYCFKKLKKTQITETDILASIEKILHDELDGITYRVLAYLLLGVVRIYSRKVEYLSDDCNKMLIEIKKFVVNTNENAPTELLCGSYHSVTIPDRFELDAFDMGSLEDVTSGHLASQREITLIDWDGIGRLSSEKSDHVEFGACHSIFSTYYSSVGSVLSSHLMDFSMELRTSSNGAESEKIIKRVQWHRFSQEECAESNTLMTIEREPQNQVKQYGEDNETNGEILEVPHIEVPEVDTQEEVQNDEILCGNDREPSCHVITGVDHQSDREEMMELELVQQENQSSQKTREEHSLRNLKADMENMKIATFSQEPLDLDVLCVAKKIQELVCSYGEYNHNEEPTKLEDMKAPNTLKNIPEEVPDLLSVAYDGSPNTKQPDFLGVTTPKLVAVPRRVSKQLARIRRKRKCVFDDIVVLPNEVIRQSIHDAKDLVAKRRKVPKNAHAVWQTQQIGNLAQNFLEPLISNVSQELRSLLCKRKVRKLNIIPEKLNLLDCQRTGTSEKIGVVETGTVEPPEDSNVLEYPCTVRSEQADIAPDTPILCSKSIKSFHSPKSPEVPDMDLVRPETSGRMQKEPSISAEQAFPTGKVEDVQSLDTDQEHDFSLLTEESEFCEGVTPEADGCSLRTRKVVRYLHRHFTICKSRGEEEVNLLEVAERRTKKECARLFYETLVLKTRGFVDVKQADPYGDILIRKLPKWEQMWKQYSR
ncbi:sister chromatid cohesion 1 protein 2-like [Argentina anserina]|uniref:sister chromatid cohesion 1 protein 2-like n=1 Tax=Argentina anserina TaxID=57926 RepID=UPI002176563D|nr:sister chromatid cohesion 1 protein 2-like [Potentilla anserina]